MALVGGQFVQAVQPVPVGSLQPFAGPNAPTGWLLCDGSTYSTSTYSELFSVLGYTYGGSGSTFNVPDMRGRVPAGRDNMGGTSASRLTSSFFGGTATSLGATGGSESHTLSTAQIPAHNHAASVGVSGADDNNHTGNGDFVADSDAGYRTQRGVSVSNTGGGGAHNNVQPTLVVNYIIKAVPDAPRSGLAYGSTPPIASTFPANPQFGEVVSFSINNGTQLVPCQWTGSRWCALVGGGPIQVVQVVKTDAMAAAPNALWGDIPGLAATITPIFNTSKVLVTVDLKGAGAQSSSVMSVRLLRDSTPVFIGDAASNRRRAMSQEYNGNISGDSNFAMAQMGGTFLDSPATTSAITYKVQFGGDSSGSVLYVNRTQGDRDNANMDARGASSITLMEMAA